MVSPVVHGVVIMTTPQDRERPRQVQLDFQGQPYLQRDHADNEKRISLILTYMRGATCQTHGTNILYFEVYLYCGSPMLEEKTYLPRQLVVNISACSFRALAPVSVTAAACFEERNRYVCSIGTRDLELLPQYPQAHRHLSNHFFFLLALRRPRPRRRQAVEIVAVFALPSSPPRQAVDVGGGVAHYLARVACSLVELSVRGRRL